MTWKLPKGEQWIKFFSQYRYVLLMMVVGVVLLLLPSGDSEAGSPVDTPIQSGVQLEEMERRLSETLSQIAGAGAVTVLLTLADDGRQVLAQDVERAGEDVTTQHIVVSDTQRGEEVVALQRESPTFRGALVLCQGGGNAQVKLDMISAVSALTGLSSDKIVVCIGK